MLLPHVRHLPKPHPLQDGPSSPPLRGDEWPPAADHAASLLWGKMSKLFSVTFLDQPLAPTLWLPHPLLTYQGISLLQKPPGSSWVPSCPLHILSFDLYPLPSHLSR